MQADPASISQDKMIAFLKYIRGTNTFAFKTLMEDHHNKLPEAMKAAFEQLDSCVEGTISLEKC